MVGHNILTGFEFCLMNVSETKSKAAALDIKSDKLIKAINDFIDLRLNVDEPDENLPERNSIAQVSKARKEKSKSIHSETEVNNLELFQSN